MRSGPLLDGFLRSPASGSIGFHPSWSASVLRLVQSSKDVRPQGRKSNDRAVGSGDQSILATVES